MNYSYAAVAKQLKAISDPKRLKIIDMLSCGELCACVILKSFQITQPTLSHDMKILVAAELVLERRDGKNIYYRLNQPVLDNLTAHLGAIFNPQASCICNQACDTTCDE